jgi:hypothetical protein
VTIPSMSGPSPAAAPVSSPDTSVNAANAQTTEHANPALPAFSTALTLALANAAGTSAASHAPTTMPGGSVSAESDAPSETHGAGLAPTTLPAGAPTTPIEGSAIRRTLDLLAPEFRDRLERVIERMESEFGYKVEVIETYRSQARQDALFARGRTDAGEVVTWTRASNHTRGRAADLVIDDSFAYGLPYERLARIASQEGLRTLGPKDPGHVELASVKSGDATPTIIGRPVPSVSSLPSIVAGRAELHSNAPLPAAPQPATTAITAIATAPARSDGVASVAPVAVVAPVAHVAQVAQVALVTPTTPGGASRPGPIAPARSRASENSARRPTPGNATDATRLSVTDPATEASRLAVGSGGALAPAARRHAGAEPLAKSTSEPNDVSIRRTPLAGASVNETVGEVLRDLRDGLMQAVSATDPSSSASSDTTSTSGASGAGHADMSERIARLLKVQDAASDRPLSQVLLRLERPDGGEDRVRVDLRGNAISATLDISDQAAADRLGANMKELHRALEQHGFDAEALTVRSTSRSAESSTLARAASAAAEADLQRAAASGSQTSTSSRDRGARHDEQRPSPDSQHQRSRRDRKGDR